MLYIFRHVTQKTVYLPIDSFSLEDCLREEIFRLSLCLACVPFTFMKLLNRTRVINNRDKNITTRKLGKISELGKILCHVKNMSFIIIVEFAIVSAFIKFLLLDKLEVYYHFNDVKLQKIIKVSAQPKKYNLAHKL